MNVYRVPLHALERLDAAQRRLVHRDPRSREWIVTGTTADTYHIETTGHPDVTAGQLEAARLRLRHSWASAVSEPLPPEVAAEAYLLLHANPELELEYMGRGRFLNEQHLPARKADLVVLDKPGGRRTYLFRKVSANEDRQHRVDRSFETWAGWLREDGVRRVVSLGGGGLRLFAATPILRVLDRILGTRSRVDEVWGSSGGAFLGYAYAHGFDMRVVDEIGFDMYHGRNDHLVAVSLPALARHTARSSWERWRGRATEHPLAGWLDELERRQPLHERVCPPIPYFAMASNTRRSEPIALVDHATVPETCRDVLIPCSARDAVCASTSVPFLVHPHRSITGQKHDTWLDGSITDENPLALPFVKWLRDRAERPETTPERLKIVSVHLNLRLNESTLVNRAAGLPIVKQLRVVKHAARIVDMALDSKTYAPLKILSAVPNVEVLTIKLSLGWFNFSSAADIPAAMRSGRSLDAWQIALHADGRSQSYDPPTRIV